MFHFVFHLLGLQTGAKVSCIMYPFHTADTLHISMANTLSISTVMAIYKQAANSFTLSLINCPPNKLFELTDILFGYMCCKRVLRQTWKPLGSQPDLEHIAFLCLSTQHVEISCRSYYIQLPIYLYMSFQM